MRNGYALQQHLPALSFGVISRGVLTPGCRRQSDPSSERAAERGLRFISRPTGFQKIMPIRKISLYENQKICILCRHPGSARGADASSRTLRREAMDAEVRSTKRADADGQVVWS
jgi:hypothetical protein